MHRHLQFQSKGAELVGALHLPDEGEALPLGLVLLHGWAGYRIGAHQMFVKLARSAAERGFPCLRFDFRGRGDSEGEASETTLTTMIEDARVAAEVILEESPARSVAFIGDCSGSEVAIGCGTLTPACRAMALWSAPIVGASREASDQAKRKDILRQYWSKLFRRETWAKLLSGRLQTGAIKQAIAGGGKGAGEEGAASDKDIDWIGRFTEFEGDVLFIYGASDPTSPEALAHYEKLTAAAGREWGPYLVEGANHAFYSREWEREVIQATLEWLEGQLDGS